MPDSRTELNPIPAEVIDIAIKAAARARYLDRWPNGDERRVERYAEEMAADPRYRVEMGAAVPVLLAAGRRQAAEAIRDAPYPNPSPCIPAWHAGYTEATETAARIAEGSTDG